MDNRQIIQNDILRYKKNKLASSIALLGLVFECLYFMLLYSLNYDFFYKMVIGFSVILTLVVLLAAFLSSEEIKGYNKTYSIVLLVLAVFQILKIFYFPLKGLQQDVLAGNYFGANLNSKESFAILVIYLVLSAACFAFSAVWGYIVAQRLASYSKALEANEVNLDAALADESAYIKPVKGDSAEVNVDNGDDHKEVK
jgi:hypothetical protein